MKSFPKRTATTALVCLVVVGGAVSAGAFGAGGSRVHSVKLKADTTTTATTTTTSTTTTTTKPTSNEDATHEAGESTTREADENAGRGFGGPDGAFHPNENSSHEQGESATREAQEDAGQRPTVQ